MDTKAAARVVALFESRGQLDRFDHSSAEAARACLLRGMERLKAATVLLEAEFWESAFTTAYDAYRTGADAVVLFLGYRVSATQGSHRIALDIAHAAMQASTDAFASSSAERFRQGRHESEYFDPARPADKSPTDATWAVELARRALEAAQDQLLS